MNTAVGSGSTGGSGTKLVVGIDGSPGALHGAAWAMEAAADARLLVLGSKPPTLADASMVTTAALIAHCQCPVVIVKPGPPAGGPVVVAVRSADESDAIEFAFHQATLRGGRLLAVHCDRSGHDTPLTPDVLATWLETASRRHPRVKFHYGSFYRSMPLPAGAKEDDIDATYTDGILTVTVPVSESPSPEKHVEIKKIAATGDDTN